MKPHELDWDLVCELCDAEPNSLALCQAEAAVSALLLLCGNCTEAVVYAVNRNDRSLLFELRRRAVMVAEWHVVARVDRILMRLAAQRGGPPIC